jgi:hypothetical protein
MAGEQVGALAVYLTGHSPTGANLFFIRDTTSHINYLVDSGAALGIVSHQSLLPHSGLAIVNANGGLCNLFLEFCKQTSSDWPTSFSTQILQSKYFTTNS